MNLKYFNFWDFFALLTLIFCFIAGIYLLAWMIWLVTVKYPKERREEEALKNALNQTKQNKKSP